MRSCTSPHGHRFEPRYDTAAPTAEEIHRIEAVGSISVQRAIAALGAKTYVKDICINCGQTINRAEEGPAETC